MSMIRASEFKKIKFYTRAIFQNTIAELETQSCKLQP